MGLEPSDVSQYGDCDSDLGLNQGATKCATLCDDGGDSGNEPPATSLDVLAYTLANLTPAQIADLPPAVRSQIAAMFAGESSATAPAESVTGDSGDDVAYDSTPGDEGLSVADRPMCSKSRRSR